MLKHTGSSVVRNCFNKLHNVEKPFTLVLLTLFLFFIMIIFLFNTFYLRLYGVRHMVKDHSDSEKGNPLLPQRLLLSINSKGSFICTIPQTGLHIPQPLLHQSWTTYIKTCMYLYTYIHVCKYIHTIYTHTHTHTHTNILVA